MKTRSSILVFLAFVFISACQGKKTKSDIEVVFTQDTLNLGYTYWWPQSGPFIGGCGEELSLVFKGTVTALKEPTNDPGPLYMAQEGIIQIERIFKIKELEKNTYAGQQFVTTDCFNDTNVSVGDQVLVFCYDFEGAYTIPGKKSILKLDATDFSTVSSIRTYIDSDQDAFSIKKDMELWSNHGLESELKAILDCRNKVSASTNATNQNN